MSLMTWHERVAFGSGWVGGSAVMYGLTQDSLAAVVVSVVVVGIAGGLVGWVCDWKEPLVRSEGK